MTGQTKRMATVAVSVGLTLLALDTGLWWWLSQRVVAQFDAWQAAEDAAGLQVTAGPARRTGWPWQAAAILPNVTISTKGAASWHTGELWLIFQPWRPGVFTAMAVGPQQVRLGPRVVEITAARIAATIPLDASASAVTIIEAHGVAAHGLAASLDTQSVAIERVSLRFTQTDLDLDASRLVLPQVQDKPALPLGGIIEALRLHARSTLPLPVTARWPTALAQWQRAGGEARVSGLDLRWGPLEAQGGAVCHLTADLQPEGSGSVRLTGFDAAVSALQRAGTISHDAARVAGAVFGLLAKTQPGQPPEVDLPLRLQDGLVSTGAIPLLRMPYFTAG